MILIDFALPVFNIDHIPNRTGVIVRQHFAIFKTIQNSSRMELKQTKQKMSLTIIWLVSCLIPQLVFSQMVSYYLSSLTLLFLTALLLSPTPLHSSCVHKIVLLCFALIVQSVHFDFEQSQQEPLTGLFHLILSALVVLIVLLTARPS